MQIGRDTTRDERLSWNPAEAIAVVRGPGPDERSTVAVAMCDQLEAAKVPIEAVEMCIMLWSRALDGVVPGPIPVERLERLDRDLALEKATSPVLASWIDALRSESAVAHDLDWSIQFLLQVRQSWLMVTAFRSRTAPKP